jgi:hypothetical protein
VTTKADFSDDEWEAMQKGVTGAGMLVSVSYRDFTDTFGEASALAKALAAHSEQGPSELIREIASGRGGGFGLTASREEVEEKTLAALRSTMETLAAKAPDEAENYRRLVISVAEAVAAAKSGIEPEETAVLGKVREALGVA